MNTSIRIFAIIGCLLIAGGFASLFTGCGSSVKRERIVTVTVPPQKQLAQAIAGDLYEIRCMIPKGSSPESYDPTPNDLMQLSHSCAYFRIGEIGFELAWMKRIEKNNRGMLIFDTSKGVELMAGGHTCNDPSHHHAGHHDPHVWSSPKQMRTVARNMADAFCQMDSDHTETYRHNLDLLLQEIDRCDSLVTQLATSASPRAFAIYHPSLSYLARDYGLTQISLEADGKEPSAAHLAEMQQQMQETGVKVVFVQQEFDRKNAEVLARENNCRLISINPLNENWKEEIITICQSLQPE